MSTVTATAFAVLITAALLLHLIGTERSLSTRRLIASSGLGLCLVAALGFGYLQPAALPVIAALLGATVWIVSRHEGRAGRTIAWSMAVVIILALGFRVLPGFERIPLMPAPAPAESLSLPAEKLLLMAVLPLLVLVPWGRDGRRMAIVSVSLGLLTVAVVILTGLYLGIASPSLRDVEPGAALGWLSYNLLAVCVLEEGFFRGIVQPGFTRALAWMRWRERNRESVSVVATSALFGLAHYGGGVGWIIVAFVAGCGYGMAAVLARCLWPAVLVHFFVNAVHYLAFAGSQG